MKRALSLVLILTLCVSLTACCCCVSQEETFTEQPSFGYLLYRIQGLFGGNGDGQKESSDVIALNPDVQNTEPVSATEAVNYMPDCVNQDYYFVNQELEGMNLNLVLEVTYVYSSDYARDRVITQNIAAGTRLYGGETVFLEVSLGEDVCPYDYSQKLVVTAASGSSYATACFYEWYNGDWQLMATYDATVGRNGIGQAYEGSRRTPQGLHKLGVILSNKTIDTNMRTYRVSSTTCIVDDPDSRYYNQIMDRSQVPSGTSYDQVGRGLTNGTTYAFIFMEHNGTGFSSQGVVSGAGSVMGIRGQYNALAPTYGDVDISVSDMMDLLSRLDSSKNPMIELKTY